MDASSGMITTGMRPRSQRGHGPGADPMGDETGQQTADQPAQEACTHEAGDCASHEPGGDAGPVRYAKGDVSRQCREPGNPARASRS